MGSAIGETLGFAVGIAVSPIPVAAVILMLFSARPRANSLSFLAGWIVGIALVTTVVSLVPGLGSDDADEGDAVGWVKLVLGLLLLLFAVRQWRGRPDPGAEPDVPRWMERIDALRPVAAVAMGFALSGVNPKNLLLAAAAGASLNGLDLSSTTLAGSIAVFTLIAGATVWLPVIASLAAGDRLDAGLLRAKSWLVGHNAAVMAVLFLVFGASLLGDAIRILT